MADRHLSLAYAVLLLASVPTAALAIDDAWYIGIGGGAALLEPDAAEAGLTLKENIGRTALGYLGRDLGPRSSAQITAHSLGVAEFEDGDDVIVYALGASVLYRFYDSRDRQLQPGALSVNLYGRLALGMLQRGSDTTLETDSAAYVGGGVGIELRLNRRLGLRAEAIFHDCDATSATVSLVTRVGGGAGARGPVSQRSEPVSELPPSAPDRAEVAEPVPASPPELIGELRDSDNDGVPDHDDVCENSASGFPVRANGCALLSGVLSGISFIGRSAELDPGSAGQLDSLVALLRQYPEARVELHAHASAFGDERAASVLTRERLRTFGTMLVSRGISAKRLVLRSFGDTLPATTDAGVAAQTANDRIEVYEHTP